MNWYFYLNYFIFRYFDKKWGKRDNPVLTALFTTSLLVHLNIFTILGGYWLVTDFWTTPGLHPHYKPIIIAWLAFLVLINYLLLYRKKKYVKVFDEFKKNNDKYKHWNLSVKLYIILSIALCLIVLIIADWRNRELGMFS